MGAMNAASLEFKELFRRADPPTRKMIRAMLPPILAELVETTRSYRRGEKLIIEVGPSILMKRILEILYEKVKPGVE